MKSNITQRPLWTAIIAIMLAFLIAASSLGAPQMIGTTLAKYSTTLSVGTVSVNVEAAHSILIAGPKLNAALRTMDINGNESYVTDGKYSYGSIPANTAVQHVEFLTTDNFVPADYGVTTTPVDVSQMQDGSIMLYKSSDGTKAYIVSDRTIATGADFSNTFNHMTGLKTVTFSPDFDTTRTTDFSYLFYGCGPNLSAINNLNTFDTTKATTMQSMFYLSAHNNAINNNLTTLNISSFTTDNVTDMGSMFRGCGGLTSLDLKKFETKKVSDMGGMFQGCDSLKTIDIRNFSNEALTITTIMFSGCSDLETIYANYDFDCRQIHTRTGASVANMFAGCSKLKGGCGTSVTANSEIENTENPDHATDNTYAVVDVTHSGSESLVFTSAKGYFTHFSAAYEDSAMLPASSAYLYDSDGDGQVNDETTKINKFFRPYQNTATAVIFGKTADYADKIQGVTGTNMTFDGSNKIQLYYANNTIYILSDKPMYFNSTADYFFHNMSALKSIHFDNISTETVGTFQCFFDGCKALEKITFGDTAVFDTSNSNDFGGFMRYCENLPTDIIQDVVNRMSFAKSLDLGGFFHDCKKLTGNLDLSHLTTPRNTTIVDMFKNTPLTTLNIVQFSSANLLKTADCFSGCTNLTTIYTSSSFDFSPDKIATLESSGGEFTGCTKLVGTSGDYYQTTFSSADRTYAQPRTPSQEGYFTIGTLPQQLSLFGLAPLRLMADETAVSDSDAPVASGTDAPPETAVSSTDIAVSGSDSVAPVVSATDVTTTVTTTTTTSLTTTAATTSAATSAATSASTTTAAPAAPAVSATDVTTTTTAASVTTTVTTAASLSTASAPTETETAASSDTTTSAATTTITATTAAATTTSTAATAATTASAVRTTTSAAAATTAAPASTTISTTTAATTTTATTAAAATTTAAPITTPATVTTTTTAAPAQSE